MLFRSVAVLVSEWVPNTARIAWLEMRTDQASATGHALNVMDDENVRQTLLEYSAIVRARDGAG